MPQAQELLVASPATCRVVSVLASGVAVAAGAVLVAADNRALHSERAQLAGELKQAQVRFRAAMREDIALAQALRGRVEAQREQLARVSQNLERLRSVPSAAGTWVSADADRLPGNFVPRGELLGVVATLDDLVVRAAADQYLGPRLGGGADGPSPWVGRGVELRNPSAPAHRYRGQVIQVARSGNNELFSPALGYFAGGTVATDQDDQTGRKASEAFFEVRIRPDTPPPGAPPLRAGQRLEVRFAFDRKPVAQQLWLALRQLLQKRLNI